MHLYGRLVYSDYGAVDKFRYFEDASSGHGYQVKKREAAYGWFLQWLMGAVTAVPFRNRRPRRSHSMPGTAVL